MVAALISWFFFTLQAHPAPIPTLSLSSAVAEAKNHSPRLQQAVAAANASDWQRVESLVGFLPQISISANHLMDVKFQVFDVTFGGPPIEFPFILPYTAAELDARLPLFDGFANVLQYQAARRMSDAAALEAQWASFQLEQDVRLKFFQALAAEKLALVADQNVKTLEDHLQKIRVRQRGGVATQFDVLRVEVQLSEARTEKLSSEDNLVLARQRLAEAMGIEADNRPLTGDLPQPAVDALKNTDVAPRDKRKDLEALNLRTEAASKRGSETGRFWVPKISLGYQYTYYNNIDQSITTNFRDAHAFGLFATWNIFDGAVSIARHQEAAEQERISEAASRSARLKQKTDLEFWRRRYLYSSNLFQARSADVNKSLESVRLATESFKAGVRTSTDVLDAELDLFRSRAGAVQAQMDSTEALINLELAMGQYIDIREAP